MSKKTVWREGEEHVISVTPVSRGLVKPLVVTTGLIATVSVIAHYWHLVAHHAGIIGLIVVGPAALVTATRWWQWRSHKIVVTSERVIVRGGILSRYLESYEISDVVATRVEQRIRERLSRRGAVYLETAEGSIFLGMVRHPAALGRLIDSQRKHFLRDVTPLDTVFSFEPDDITPPVFKTWNRGESARGV